MRIPLNITLLDTNSRLVECWRETFAEERVTIQEGDLTTADCDAIVSPANSFGFMDGGVDYAISVRLGWHVQQQVQRQIQALPEGELLVGKALVIETGYEGIPYLIVAPTMRVPTSFAIPTSVNAYLAMKAILIATQQDGRMSSVAIPGLCTGSGKMNPAIAARQMHMAYREVVLGERPVFQDYREAYRHQLKINPEGRFSNG